MNNIADKIPQQIGPYRISEVLGKGGMGVVYRAEHIETGEPAALKTVFVSRERQLASIRREIRALANISHPGIIRIIEEGIADGKPWYAMELITGVTLDTYCSEVIWESAPFSRHWTSATERQFVTGTSTSEPVWWKKLLGTTVDSVDELVDGISDENLESIKIPTSSRQNPIPAAGGHLAEVITLFYRICRSLAYLHGQGIVHRDLKPSNIFIRSDGFPVIMDFGLMLEFQGTAGREDLESFRHTGGTLLYIPPEQISGEITDARADLYTLGCIMYEFVTGQLPFIVTSVSQAVQAHMKLVPVPPSSLVDGVPGELDELILNLLKKRPRDRIGHADGIATILTRLGADTHYPVDLPKSRAYLYRPRFRGRIDLLESIGSRVQDLEHGQSGCILIGGEGGIGKTRFLQEIWRMGNRLKIRIFSGECMPGSATPSLEERQSQTPLMVLRKTFREIVEYCLSVEPAERERIIGPRGPILANFFPEMASLNTLMTHPEPPDLKHDAARLRLFNFLTQTLSEIARTNPVMLLLDDLQWVDEVTRDFMMFLLRTGIIDRFPILIIGTYRKEEALQSIDRLIRSTSAVQMELPCLDESAVGEMVSDMLAKTSPSEKFIRFLSRFSDGNPFLVSEYLRACIEENLLFWDNEGRWQITPEGETLVTDKEITKLPVPQTLIVLISRRLDLLSDTARDLAYTAAVIGREIDMMILWNIVSFQADVLDAMDELLRCQILAETTPGILHFLHDIIHQLTYERIEDEKRRQLHHKIAESLELVFPHLVDDNLAVLARHWEQAGDSDKARSYFLSAARKAVVNYALINAGKLYQSYFNLCEIPTHETVRARNEYARNVLRLQARPEEALKEHRIALRNARRLNSPIDIADSIIGITQYQVISGKHRRARLLLEKCLEIYKEQNSSSGETKALKRLGFITMREGDFKAAKKLLTQALQICRDSGDRNSEASVLSDFGYLLFKENRWDDALENQKKALEIQRKLGNRHLEARNLKNLAMVYLARGNYSLAKQVCEEALSIVREVGERNHEGQLAYQLAGINYAMGEMAAARDLYEKSLKIRSEYGDRVAEGMIREKLGRVYFAMHRIGESAENYQKAIDLFHDLNLEHYSRSALLGLARINRKMRKKYSESGKLLKEARLYSEKVNDHLVLCLCACQEGHLVMALGNSGRPFLEEALQIQEEYSLGSKGLLQEHIHSLTKAVETFEAGGTLIHGELPDETTGS